MNKNKMNKKFIFKIMAGSFIFAAVIIFLIGQVFAAATATPATGGSAISADTAGGAYTSLTGPVISEGATADIGIGTIILNAPSGFEFDTGGAAPTVLVTRIGGSGSNSRNINDLASNSTIAVSRTLTALTITITDSTSNGVKNSLTWQNVRVRPTAGTPLASGNIVKSGTSSISGITGSTNLGTLTEVAGIKTNLVYTAQPSATAAINFDFPVKPVVAVRDQFGNTVTSDNTTTVALSAVLSTQSCGGTAGNGGLSSTPASGAAVTAGVITYTAMQYSYIENIKICASSTGVASALSNAISITAGPTAQLFLNDATSITAGTRAAYTVTRKDQFGNLTTSGNETFYLYSNATGGFSAFYDAETVGNIITSITIPNGASSAQFWYYDQVAATPTITISDNSVIPDGDAGINDASDQITVSAANVNQFILNNPGSITAGSRASYAVTRKDQFGNLTASGNTTVYLYSDASGSADKFYNAATDGNIIASIIIPDGSSTANFWYYDELAGSPTVTASDNSLAPDGSSGIVDATNQISIVAGSVAQFALSDAISITAGSRASYTVTRKDQFGNLTTNGDTAVYLYTNSTGTSTAFYNAAVEGNVITSIQIINGNSFADFWYFDSAVGNWNITASDNASTPDGNAGIIDSVDNLAVNAAPIVATRFTIVVQSSATAGDTVEIIIRAEDPSGNLDATYNGGVTLITSGSATLGGLINVINGIGTVNITDTVAETVNLSLSDTQGTGLDASSTAQVVFNPGSVAQFVLNEIGSMIAGNRASYTVTRKDQFGNLVTSGNTTVYFYSNAGSGFSAFYDAAIGGNIISSISINNGTSSGNIWYYEGGVGTWNITASDNSTMPDGNAGVSDAVVQIEVFPSSVSQFTLNNPGDMTAGTRLGYIVSRQDEFGNSVTSGNQIVYLYSTSNGTSTAFYGAATGGNPVSQISIADNYSSADFWYFEENAGAWTITVSDNAAAPDGNSGINDASDSVNVSAAPITATRLAISQILDAQVGQTVAVTIRAEDNNGNVDTAFNNEVTLNLTGSATGAGLISIINGIGTANVSDSVAETITLSLSDTQNTGLDVLSTRTLTFSAVAPAPRPAIVSGGGSAIPLPTTATVVFSGRTFPGAQITILTVADGNIPVSQRAVASREGNFTISFNGVLPGNRQYILAATDQNQRLTQSKIYNLAVSPSLIEKNVALPPTVGFMRRVVTKGGFLGINGYTVPDREIEVELDGEILPERAMSSSNGKWNLLFNTLNLSIGEHKIRARQKKFDGSLTEFSPINSFAVINSIVSSGDLNDDGQVNASDISIFISKWLSSDAKNRLQLDFNRDEKVDAQDFSIFIRALVK